MNRLLPTQATGLALPFAVSALLLLNACGGGADSAEGRGADRSEPAEPIVVYSARKEHLIKSLLDRFTAVTGIPVELLTDSAEPLLARLEAEGVDTPADLLITVDAGNLWQAAERNLLRPLKSPFLNANIPAHLRDEQGRWFGLSRRARTIIYHSDRVDPGTLGDYADLAKRRWRGKLCLRSGKKIYNRSLVASMLAHYGEGNSLRTVRRWVANLAAEPFDSDTRAMEAILAGRCDLTVVNSYYFGRLQRDWQKDGRSLPLKIFWPGQAAGQNGVHINVSGAGIVRHSSDFKAARRLLEWLSEPEAQTLFAESNLEYPVNPEAGVAPLVAAWGDFRSDTLPVSEFGRLQPQAVRLIDRAGYH